MVTGNSEHAEKQDKISCPVCGSQKSETVFTHARLANIERTYASKQSAKELMTSLNTNMCTVCGMLYRVPLMTEDELSQYYSRSYYETYNAGLKNQDGQSYVEQLQSWEKRYTRYLRFLARNGICLTGKRVLDVGCGKGYFLSAAREKGAVDCWGIEPSRQCYEKLRSGKEYDFRVLNKCIRDVCPEEIGRFDLVTCIGVLEHLSEPILDLKVCRSLMNDDAHLYIFSHNEAPSLFTDIRKRISLVHQLYFTRRTVRILLMKVGLQIVDLETRNTDMHILARKCQPVSPECEIGNARYSLLKTRYLVCKRIPSAYFSVASWLYGKYLALRDRVVYKTI
jgi:2-polyprenyl-3-methyl-5-hydroxy-6-metoxy-1,4-benzoquinol methylase